MGPGVVNLDADVVVVTASPLGLAALSDLSDRQCFSPGNLQGWIL